MPKRLRSGSDKRPKSVSDQPLLHLVQLRAACLTVTQTLNKSGKVKAKAIVPLGDELEFLDAILMADQKMAELEASVFAQESKVFTTEFKLGYGEQRFILRDRNHCTCGFYPPRLNWKEIRS